MEIDVFEKREGVNFLAHGTNVVLVNDSSCMQEPWKRPKEIDEESIRLMEFKGNIEKANRKHFLCNEEAEMSFSSSLVLITLLFFLKELKLFKVGNISLELDFKSFVSRVTWGFKFFHFYSKQVINKNYFKPDLGKDVGNVLRESLVLQNS